MTALLVLVGIFIVLVFLLVLPITLKLSFDEDFKFSVYVLGIRVFSSYRKPEEKAEIEGEPQKTEGSEENKEKPNRIKEFFEAEKSKRGFSGAVCYCAKILGIILRKVLWYVKTLKFRKFFLEITVATDDAAKTGLEYGAVCSAVYPIISFLATNADFKTKDVKINADFEGSKPSVVFESKVKTMPLTAIIAALSAFREYKRLKKESEKIERE